MKQHFSSTPWFIQNEQLITCQSFDKNGITIWQAPKCSNGSYDANTMSVFFARFGQLDVPNPNFPMQEPDYLQPNRSHIVLRIIDHSTSVSMLLNKKQVLALAKNLSTLYNKMN